MNKGSCQHCIRAIAGKVLNLRSVHLINDVLQEHLQEVIDVLE